MKTRILAIIALTALILALIPVNALGAGCSVTNFDYNPRTMKDTGGEVTLSFTINNNSGKVVDRYYIYLFGGLYANRDCNIADNTFLNVTPKITLAGADLGVWIPLTVDVLYTNGTSETIYTKNIKVDPIPDVIYSTKTAIIPDNSVYHIGETVQMVDNFLNRSTEIVTGVTVQYYKKGNNTIVYEDERIDLGTIYDGDAVNYTYVYTFVPEDVGKIEIASIIRYTYQGGKYEEYCVSHYFTIDDEVVTSTPTQAPAATPAPQPTAEPTATLAPSESIALSVKTTSKNVDSGDEVTFSIDLKNESDFDISSVDIYDNDNLITTFNNIAAGHARRYMYTVTVDKTTAFNFSAKSAIKGKMINVFADIITINVNDSDSGIDSPSGGSVGNSDNSLNNNSNSTGSDSDSAVTPQNSSSRDALLIAAIAVGAVLFITLIIVGAILIVRSSGNK